MTRKEAIHLLDNLIGMVADNHGNDYDSALHMAIDTMRKYQMMQADYEARLKADLVAILDKIRADIIKYESDCRLSVDEYPSCKQCTDNVFESIYRIIDKCKADQEDGEKQNELIK